MKYFNQHELSKTILLENLDTETVNDKRYYITPDGAKYVSVTTLLGHEKNSDKNGFLAKWKKRVGEEEAKRITDYACETGTSFHLSVEKYLSNDNTYLEGISVHNKYMFLGVQKYLDKIDNVLVQEAALYSKKFKIAGRTDLIAEYEDRLSIIDFKTSKKEKKEEWIEDYYLQGTCYSLMLEEMTGLVIDEIVIIMVQYDGSPTVYKTNRKLHFKRLAEVMKKTMPKLLL